MENQTWWMLHRELLRTDIPSYRFFKCKRLIPSSESSLAHRSHQYYRSRIIKALWLSTFQSIVTVCKKIHSRAGIVMRDTGDLNDWIRKKEHSNSSTASGLNRTILKPKYLRSLNKARVYASWTLCDPPLRSASQNRRFVLRVTLMVSY